MTEIEREEIDRAIALSLAEADPKGKKVMGEIYAFAVLCNFLLKFGIQCARLPKMYILNIIHIDVIKFLYNYLSSWCQ